MLKHGEAFRVYQTQEAKPSRGRSKRTYIPDFIKDKPSLDVALAFYWDSYYELATEKMVEGGQIPHHAIVNYCDRNEVIEFESFLRIIREMDSIVLQHQRDKISNGA